MLKEIEPPHLDKPRMPKVEFLIIMELLAIQELLLVELVPMRKVKVLPHLDRAHTQKEMFVRLLDMALMQKDTKLLHQEQKLMPKVVNAKQLPIILTQEDGVLSPIKTIRQSLENGIHQQVLFLQLVMEHLTQPDQMLLKFLVQDSLMLLDLQFLNLLQKDSGVKVVG